MANRKIVLTVATGNKGKLREIDRIFSDFGLPVVLQTISEALGETPDIPETADTFAGNAEIKADYVHARTAGWVLADDSGLEVDALGGEPGVFSARYAGEPVDDSRNIAKLLDNMRDVPAENRTARFRCVMALVGPDGFRRTVDGKVEGAIAFSPAGSNGFGYDPLFVPSGWEKTFAEAEDHEKNSVSHRGRALIALRQLMKEILSDREMSQ